MHNYPSDITREQFEIIRGDIYDIKSSDMIYTKEYKEKNKNKRICKKVPPEKI